MSVLESIVRQLELYPESTLADIYKSFFQDEFGPGHILSDPEGARDYFNRELAGMKSRKRHRAEYCGTGRNFCRLPMDMVLDGVVCADDYFTVFLSGTRDFRLPDIQMWKEKWQSVYGLLKQSGPALPDFEKDGEAIAAVLERGGYAMHHSARYRLAYDPHYRIIRKEDALSRGWIGESG